MDKHYRIKTCSSCDTNFACYPEDCWCSKLPPVMDFPPVGDCYCPKCLNKIIQEKTGLSSSTEEKRNREPLTEDIDYYYNNDGNWVFTAQYHLKRGYCCKNGCLHCPYGFRK